MVFAVSLIFCICCDIYTFHSIFPSFSPLCNPPPKCYTTPFSIFLSMSFSSFRVFEKLPTPNFHALFFKNIAIFLFFPLHMYFLRSISHFTPYALVAIPYFPFWPILFPFSPLTPATVTPLFYSIFSLLVHIYPVFPLPLYFL